MDALFFVSEEFIAAFIFPAVQNLRSSLTIRE